MDIKPPSATKIPIQTSNRIGQSAPELKAQTNNPTITRNEIIQANNLVKQLHNKLLENVITLTSNPITQKQLKNLPANTPTLSKIYFTDNKSIETNHKPTFLNSFEINTLTRQTSPHKIFLLSNIDIKKLFAGNRIDLQLNNTNAYITLKQKAFFEASIFNQIYYASLSKISTQNKSLNPNTSIQFRENLVELNLIKHLPLTEDRNPTRSLTETANYLQNYLAANSLKHLHKIYTQFLIHLIRSEAGNLSRQFTPNIKLILNQLNSQNPNQTAHHQENITGINLPILFENQAQEFLIEQWKKLHKDRWRSYYESTQSESNISFMSLPIQLNKRTGTTQIKLETFNKNESDVDQTIDTDNWKLELEIDIDLNSHLLVHAKHSKSNLTITLGANNLELFTKIENNKHILIGLCNLINKKNITVNLDKNLNLSINKIKIPKQHIEA
ncbi:hypothetical protein [Sessilibacter sp. MAH4]